MTSIRNIITFMLFSLALTSSAWANEFHLYYIAGGYTTNSLYDEENSIHFLTQEMAAHGPQLKQFITHNFTTNLCDFAANKYFEAQRRNKQASIGIFAFSWGVPKALQVARCLNGQNIPIEMMIGVDGIPKGPLTIGRVPSNVEVYFNLYSRHGGLANLVNTKVIRPMNPRTKVYNQEVPGQISHPDFDNGIQHCSLNLLYNWVEGYRLRPRPCQVRN